MPPPARVEEAPAVQSPASIPTPAASEPTPAQVPQPSAPVPPASTAKSSRRRPKRTNNLKLGDDLSAMQADLEKKAAEAKARYAQDEQVTYSVNPAVQVDEGDFQTALSQYAERLKAINKMNLASILLNGKTTFTHNRWEFVVENELQLGMIEKEKALLPFLREQLKVVDLFLQLSYNEEAARQADMIPYTDDEKLKVMSDSNPALRRLQEIFKTRIIY